MSLQDVSLDLATKGHAGQERKYSELPYIVHPKAVVALLKEWGVDDDEMLAAGFGHDLLEDTQVSESQIRSLLGNNVLNLIQELTKPENKDKSKWLRDLAKNASARAVLVKIADRICNTRDYFHEHRQEYAKQYFHKADSVFKRLKNEKSALGSRVVANAIKDWLELENELDSYKKANTLVDIANKIAKDMIASKAETEVERLLKIVLKGSSWQGHVFAVGGYPRDQFRGLGEEAKDLDITVDIKEGAKKITQWLHNMFPVEITHPHQMGANYPIWQITFKDNINYQNEKYETEGAVIEFADTMKESFPDEASRQRDVEWGTLQDDIERRDLSVNSLLKDLSTGEFVDLTGHSKNDIKEGILRGNKGVDFDKILKEDPLRLIRILRFQCKYDWKIPLSVLKIMKHNAERIKIVSAERIMGELTKIMKLGKLHKAIRLMDATGLLEHILPEIHALKNTKQSPDHHYEGTVWKHLLLVLKNAEPTIEGQMAALLHDVGKPFSMQIVGDKIKFKGHAEVGAEIAEAILYRLKFDADTIKKITKMVANHMRPLQLQENGEPSEKALRKFIREIGDETVDALLNLAEADSLGSFPIDNQIPALREQIKRIRESPLKVTNKPVLDGLEIMDLLKIKAGPKIGEVGKWLLNLADEYAEKGQELTKEEAKQKVLEKFKP